MSAHLLLPLLLRLQVKVLPKFAQQLDKLCREAAYPDQWRRFSFELNNRVRSLAVGKRADKAFPKGRSMLRLDDKKHELGKPWLQGLVHIYEDLPPLKAKNGETHKLSLLWGTGLAKISEPGRQAVCSQVVVLYGLMGQHGRVRGTQCTQTKLTNCSCMLESWLHA
jgi:hypothetical protein